jgi:phosphate uptake regulator
MEIRKIQRTGGSSYAVSLPKKWVVANSLKEGDRLALEELPSGELLVFPLNREALFGDYVLRLEGEVDPEHVLRTLIAIYLSGYDGITIRSEPVISEGLKKAVLNFTSRTIGMEVMEETRDTIALRELMGSPDVEPLKILARMSTMAMAGMRDVANCLERPSATLLAEVVERDLQIDRLHLLLDREFNRAMRHPLYAGRLGVNLTELWSVRNVSKTIERIGDHVERMASLLLQYGRPLRSTGLRELFDRAVETFEDALDAYMKKDVEGAQRIIDTAEGASTDASRLPEGCGGDGGIYAVLLAEDLVRIISYSADIAEAAIDMGVR